MFPNGMLELFQLRVGLEEIAPSDNEILNSRAFRRDNIEVRFPLLHIHVSTCLPHVSK